MNIIDRFVSELKTNATVYEIMVKNELVEKGVKHEFQYPIRGIGFNYILDFIMWAETPTKQYEYFAIEIDGKHHHEPETKKKDDKRSKRLLSLGIKVVRFDNSEIKKDLAGVIKKILELGVVRQAPVEIQKIVKPKKIKIRSVPGLNYKKKTKPEQVPVWLLNKERRKKDKYALKAKPISNREGVIKQMEYHKQMSKKKGVSKGQVARHFSIFCELKKYLEQGV